ncbi:UNVERIFIED_ORG: glycine amidinotransferase [Dietzia maris]|uniref:glycine amidinotransferase n=1 Tax=Dietzia maris TaxID=37915 RepID=UPI0010433ABF
MKANSFNEWSRLREAIVGTSAGYEAHELELSFRLFFNDVAHSSFFYPSLEARGPLDAADSRRDLNHRYVEELAEDVEGLAQALASAGVVVHRPEALPPGARFSTPHWEATMIPALNVRDQTIVIGDEIIETAPQVRARQLEGDLLKPVLSHYFREGSRWTSMPRPRMLDASFDTSYVSGHATPAIEYVGGSADGSPDAFEIMLDGAQAVRFGKDVLVNVSTANHLLGAEWLKRHLEGRFRVQIMHRFADNHIDSLVLPLRPGLLLLRNPSVAERLPAPLQAWDRIYAPTPSEMNFPVYGADDVIISSPYIDMNVLSVDENTVVANSLFPELISELERNGFDVIPVRHRHRRLFGGGFHCFTLDTVRDGGLEDYFGYVDWNL